MQQALASSPASANDGGRGALSAPETIQMAFALATTLQEAREYTRRLTLSHYENFSVISMLLPRELRQHFCNVYAFCRTADDLGDEVGDRDQSMALLDRFRHNTRDCYDGKPATLIFIALRETILQFDIPPEPFLDLIDAFEQDQRITRYQTFDDVVGYCRRSANPVGRLVLYMCGYRDAQRQRLSDYTCTALQLANFWQDVRRDLIDRDRIYIPRESMELFGVTEQQMREGRFDRNYRNLIHFEVDRTRELFDLGDGLLPLLSPRIRPQISLFSRGGRAVLSAIRGNDYDTLTRRPSLSKASKAKLIASTLVARLTPSLARVERRGTDS